MKRMRFTGVSIARRNIEVNGINRDSRIPARIIDKRTRPAPAKA